MCGCSQAALLMTREPTPARRALALVPKDSASLRPYVARARWSRRAPISVAQFSGRGSQVMKPRASLQSANLPSAQEYTVSAMGMASGGFPALLPLPWAGCTLTRASQNSRPGLRGSPS